MKQEEIPTAEDFVINFENRYPRLKACVEIPEDRLIFYHSAQGAQVCVDMMIEFAKLHVTQALKEALDSIPCLGSSSDIPTYEEVEEAVLSAYPLDLIK
jgi:hypothetical protein